MNANYEENENSNNNIVDLDNEDQCQVGTYELDEEENEMYAIDIDFKTKQILFGGKGDYAEVYDYREDRIITKVEGFDDSIIYTKFLANGRFLVVTVDGTIALMEDNKDASIFSIEEDISVAKFNEKLVIGTVSGQVYLYDSDLEHINTFGGHVSEIISVDFCEGKALSMCKNNLIAHDQYGRTLYTLKAMDAHAFKYIASDVLCFAREKKIQIFKENKKLFEYSTEDEVECIEYLNKSLVVGGNFETLLLIDTTGHYAIFKLNIKACTVLIKKYDDFTVAFSTTDGLIGLVDIRSIATLKYYNPNAGTIFDFSVSPEDIAVVGENGFNIINLQESPQISI